MTARARVERLLDGARLIRDPASALGRRARAELPATTRLSPEGVALALAECLEATPSEPELDALLVGVRPARRALVLLPANVFVAAHRALALALAASATVLVRPSRREPRFVELLAAAAPGLFEIVTELEPETGDAYFAYGADETLASVRSRLPPGVELHAQGPGHGVAVVDRANVTEEAALALARDLVPFDQRGCLSPRVALVHGGTADARRFAELVASALVELERTVPLGTLDDGERADSARFRDTATYTGSAFAAGAGTVACLPGPGRLLAPNGRNLAVFAVDDPVRWLAPVAAEVTALGLALPDGERRRHLDALPRARASALGAMQRPRFDGPADRRSA
jgi:acyl-CoA reductase-like NAD-dependent aldehyde dehydrogenase